MSHQNEKISASSTIHLSLHYNHCKSRRHYSIRRRRNWTMYDRLALDSTATELIYGSGPSLFPSEVG